MPESFSAIEIDPGPLRRIRARAEVPGGVAQAVMVSFSKGTGTTLSQIIGSLGESNLWRYVEGKTLGLIQRWEGWSAGVKGCKKEGWELQKSRS